MADNNRNQRFQNFRSSNDWEQNKNRMDEDYNSENYSSYGNAGFKDYDNQTDRNNDQWRRQQQNRQGYQRDQVNYLPDNDDNRNYSQDYNQNWRDRGYGEQNSFQGHRNDQEWQRSGYQGRQGYNQDWNRNRGNFDQDAGYGYQNDHRGYEGRNYGERGNINDTRNHNQGSRYGSERGVWDKTRDEVSSWFGDDDAERRRDMDRGQTGEHRGKGPRGYQRSKERIHEDICDRLTYDDRIDASEVDVKVEDNEVILTGTVTSREEKRRAEDLAESISGVRNVQNRLRIAPPDVGTTETTNTIIRKAGNMSTDEERL